MSEKKIPHKANFPSPSIRPVPDGPGGPPRAQYDLYRIDGMSLMKLDPEDGTEREVAAAVYIESVRHNVDTQKITLALRFAYKGSWHSIEVPRGTLTRAKLPQLLDYGVDVADHKARDVMTFLNLQEQGALKQSVHTGIGFTREDGKLVFRHWNGIGCSSVYRGPLKLEPTGTLDGWREVVNKLVIGRAPMELALSLGLAAPVAALIAEHTSLDVIVGHIFADSTRGKSTATRLAVSPFGLPHTSDGGLIHTWNGTSNAIVGHFRGVFGIPMALDEASMHAGTDFSQLIYTLASGTEKARMTSDGEMRSTAQWKGLILSNAEHSLLDKSNQNIGIRMRLIEIGNLTWTDSAEHADALTQGLMSNYGHAGPVFVEHMMKLGPEALMERWRNCRADCLARIGSEDNPFGPRIADRLAVIVLAAELGREALDVDIDRNAVMGLLTDNEADLQGTRDIGATARDTLRQTVTRYHRNFNNNGVDEQGFELWGRIEKRLGREYVAILPSVLHKILADAGFQDHQVILRNWKDRGWLDHDKNSLRRKKAIRGTSSGKTDRDSVYCVWLEDPPPPSKSLRKMFDHE